MFTPVLHIKDDPHQPCSAAVNSTYHTDPTLLVHCIVSICYVFVSCVQRGAVEGSGVSSGGCVVHFDVHGE